MSDFVVVPNAAAVSDAERAEILTNPGFGHHYTDHMALATWTKDAGWHDTVVTATGPLELHPSTASLHYGQEIFEGMKAYRHADGSVWLFRPEMNARRFARSAERLAMQPLPEQLFLDSVLELVKTDAAWVPSPEGEQNLYLRPFMIASEHLIGVRPALEYLYCVLATPVGAYYADPLKLWITPNFSRTAPGGTGAAKCGGNYAASLAAANEAEANGCGQVLWLDGGEHRWVEECGTMNIAFITADGEFLTPELNGDILPGVTRDSLLQIAPDHGLVSVERPIDVEELKQRVADGTITEVLACGTAAVVTPITGFKFPDGTELTVGDGTVGPKTKELRAGLLDIQYGRVPDTRGWMVKVC